MLTSIELIYFIIKQTLSIFCAYTGRDAGAHFRVGGGGGGGGGGALDDRIMIG